LVQSLTDHRPESGNHTTTPATGFQNARERRRESAMRQEQLAKQKRAIQQRIQSSEELILQLEARQTELTQSMESPETFASPETTRAIHQELAAIVEQLQQANQ